ncbi:MAG: hypothetical protein Q9170_005078 [Blastenia crenularia]
MGDPVTPSLGFAASAAKFVAQLSGVRDETGVVIGQVKVVTNDITMAEKLYLKKKLYLCDEDRSEVEEVIRNTRLAVNRIAKEVEPARKDVLKLGTIHLVDRVDWILRRSGSTETYQHSLETCHRSLLDRISMLRTVQPRADEQAGSLPEQTSTRSAVRPAQTQSDPEESDDENSSRSSSEGVSDLTEGLNGSVPPSRDSSTTGATPHPERALWEATQLNYTRKLKKQKPALHPERLLYEEMQQRYKQR